MSKKLALSIYLKVPKQGTFCKIAPMLKVQKLSKQYSDQILFEETSFVVGLGEKIGLVGRNGTGKSTLFKLIRGLEVADSGEITHPKDYRIGALEQHIEFTKPTVLEEACLALREEEAADSYKAEKILMGLGFTKSDFSRPPSSFSGGYQVRINLAKAILQRPSLLLLDEPTNYLDIVSMSWLKKFLRQYEGEFMLITHDRQFMDEVVTHVMGIHRGRVKKYPGDTAHFYQRLMEEEELYEKTRVNLEQKKKELTNFITRFGAKASKAAQAQSKAKQLAKLGNMSELKDENNLSFAFNYKDCPAKTLMTVQNLSFSYDQKAESDLFTDLNLTVAAKDRIGIVGKNGKGKSTFLNVIAGELKPRTGQITGHHDLRMGFFGQTNIQRLNLEKDIIQEISDVNEALPIHRIRSICGTMMFPGDLAKKKIKVLSGGERARVMLGKILAVPTNMLLLDEPTNHLDMQSIQALVDEIDDYPGALLVVTHSEMLLHAFAKKLLVFGENGAEIFDGTYQDFLDKIGWDDDGKIKKKQQRQPLSFDHTGKSQHEIQRERAQKVTPIKEQIESLEKKIIEHEEMAKKIEEKLIDAYAKNLSSFIQEFSPIAAQLKSKIEGLYQCLEDEYNHLAKMEDYYKDNNS